MSRLVLAAILHLAADPSCGKAVPGSEFAVRLVAVAKHESGGDPFAINVNGVNGGTRRFSSSQEALAFARALDAQGRDYDAGLMQINRRQFARHGLTPETVFDACTNMAAGAVHLASDAEAVWRGAHSRYNTGDPQRGIANGYVAEFERTLAETRQALSTGAQTPTPARPPSRPAHTAARGAAGRELVLSRNP